MNRQDFLKTTAAGMLGISLSSWTYADFKRAKQTIIGHGDFTYKIDFDWGALDPTQHPVNDCHEMVQDRKGRIFMITNETKNNILIYNRSGKLLDSWGTEYPGGHGLSIHDENGTEFLYICDNNRHEVIKTTLDGRVVHVFEFPAELEQYDKPEAYIPTESCVAPNGDVYVADGYGSQYIIHYDAKGSIKNVFGGRGTEDHLFLNAHGICIDQRDGQTTLLITEREQNSLKRFSLDGTFIEKFELPGAYICRPVVHGNEVYLATIWSGDKAPNTGFISVLDSQNRLVSAPGGIAPQYDSNNQLVRMRQEQPLFKHPHDVCVDSDENLYVCQWNAGKTYPIKLTRV